MTKDFDIVVEQKLSTENSSESQFVNVGWGSFETQFKGSQGKNAVKEKFDDKSFDWDDKKARICWRSDGEYFVVHFIDLSTNSRKFQVFNREGNLHSTIEKNVNILDAPIAWKYSKSNIAASINRLNKHEIIFFEKNGLAHGSFNLPFTPGQMKVNGIYWNLDSTILCIWSELVNENNANSSEYQSIVQLWSVSNYYWYLKQSYHFSMPNKVTCVSWDPEDSYKLHLITKQGQYINYKLGWTVNNCNKVKDYNGSIAVIDSSNVLITPFKDKVIPPPMSHFKLNCQKPINNLAWSNNNMDLIVYLFDQTFVVFRLNKINDNPKNGTKFSEMFKYEASNVFKLENDEDYFKNYNTNIHHMIWTEENELVLIADCNDGITMITLDLISNQSLDLRIKNKLEINFNVYNAVFNSKSKHIALQSSTGQLYIYAKHNDNWSLIDDQFKFPQPCPNYSLVSLPSDENSNKEVFVGLSQFYRLYVDKTEVANNCNSFVIHDNFILFTDHTNNLKFIDLRKLNESGSKKIHEEAFRRVERGAKLVNAIHYDTVCILQMPRGNLEAIHPRTLVISKLKSDIDNLKYLNAVERMRKHRVNMNILFDHNPKVRFK
jgi:elongator complex protein 1